MQGKESGIAEIEPEHIDVMSRRPGWEKALYRGIPAGFSGRWDPAWRCLTVKCFNGNNCDEEKPRKTSKYA
jgi:hypothetical protein